MEELKLDIKYCVASFDSLTDSDRTLVEQAKQATYRSYAPYSKFNVGAAIQLDNDVIITGANQENVAYPSGTCAERTACYYAHAQYPDAKFTTIAIAARGTDGNEVELPIAPCGACRQALLEYEMLAQKNVRVILVSADKIYILPSVKSLLPFAFSEFS